MTTPRRTYSEADLRAAIEHDRQLERAKATEEAMAEFMVDEKRWRAEHGDSHERMADGIVEIREELRHAVLIEDPSLREALPDMARDWVRTRAIRKRDRALLTGWAGRVTFLTVAGSFLLLLLTSLGVLPPKAPAPVRNLAPITIGSPHP